VDDQVVSDLADFFGRGGLRAARFDTKEAVFDYVESPSYNELCFGIKVNSASEGSFAFEIMLPNDLVPSTNADPYEDTQYCYIGFTL